MLNEDSLLQSAALTSDVSDEATLRKLLSNVGNQGPTTGVTAENAAVLTARFSSQGIQWNESIKKLWCLLCTVRSVKNDAKPLSQCLAVIGVDEGDVLTHCSTREHLCAYEEKNPLHFCCPVKLQGQKMLLSNHCIYPRAAFGEGSVLKDETVTEKVLVAADICGGVKLMPQHEYSVVELVVPHFLCDTRVIQSSSTSPEEREYLLRSRALPYSGTRYGKRLRTQTMLEKTNREISDKLSAWSKGEALYSATVTDA